MDKAKTSNRPRGERRSTEGRSSPSLSRQRSPQRSYYQRQRRNHVGTRNLTSLSLSKRWLIFIKERFSPITYVPMILLFVSMNGAFGSNISGVSWINPHLAIVIPLIMSFFFRMRLFDEIKDYKTDINVNPKRPLPRGLLRIHQVKKMIFALMLIELPLAASLGLPVFAAYIMGLCFSLLMYNEFFLSDFLRHKLTTYAVSHTFVSIILGMITSLALVGTPSTLSLNGSLGFFFSNWALFNLFEFARKSFAPSEERENVPTYSSLFGIRGAWALSMSQILLTHGALYIATQSWNIPLVGITLGYIVLSLYYLIAGTEKAAVFFRNLTSVVLLLSEISILYWLR